MKTSESALDSGITSDKILSLLAVVAQPIEQLREFAKVQRSGREHIGYKRSVLRKFPCVLFDGHFFAPLRELLFQRVTTGLYFDAVNAGPEARNEVGKRFEIYCRELIGPTWVGVEVAPSYRYRPKDRKKGNEIDTPDLFLKVEGSVAVIMECKAKRMSFEARSNESPLENGQVEAGHDELAKGVFQIWRFASHSRRGLLPASERLAPEAIGVVITLEPWLTMTRGAYTPLIERAKTLVAETGEDVTEQDMVPVSFCPVEDLENMLPVSTLGSFVATMRLAASDEYAGYHMKTLHRQFVADGVVAKPYPFHDRLDELLPWWRVTLEDHEK